MNLNANREHRTCVGGPLDRPCLSFGQHTTDCPATADKPCRGCAPRPATQGHLCDTCDTYLRQWLNCTSRDEYQPNSILWVHWWLGLAQSVRSQRSKWGDKIKTSRDDLPSPLNEAIMDCRTLLSDRVYIIEERTREVIGLPAPGVFDFGESVAWLSRHVIRIEDDPDLCRHTWDRLQESMTTAHQLAPWRAAIERLQGIPCPHCERNSLVIFGGDDFATCQTCRATVISKRFDQWAAMVNHEKETA